MSDGPHRRAPTQAADGLPRRRFTADELRAMEVAGILGDEERVELIGGDIVVMSPKGRHHEILRTEIFLYWVRRGPTDLKISSEAPLRLVDDTEPVPDLVVYPASLVMPDVRAATALLVVEVADSSLNKDHRYKAPVYAASGVPEYWVINAVERTTTIYRDPGPDGYATRLEAGPADTLVPHLAPGLALRPLEIPEG
ncbi:MAG: Uma2 family endonuclease [Hyphomicrobiaceae bacterium]|nr:Uma2 family endonuclease [Hyphomicrobiaceae bacterium]